MKKNEVSIYDIFLMLLRIAGSINYMSGSWLWLYEGGDVYDFRSR